MSWQRMDGAPAFDRDLHKGGLIRACPVAVALRQFLCHS